jgi:mono/diheme cytochrome c family protein
MVYTNGGITNHHTPTQPIMKQYSPGHCFAVIAAATILLISCSQSAKQDSAATPSQDSLQASIARGKYLAYHVTGCMDCHSQRDFTRYGGPVTAGTEGKGGDLFGPLVGIPGEIYAPNITPAALMDWTDEEIVRAMTEGINRKGDTLFPIMPYLVYRQMPKEDIEDIVRFIRTLTPQEHTVAPRKLFIPISAAVPPLSKPDLVANNKPERKDLAAYGEYLVRIASCSDCHTPMVNGMPDLARYLSGGNSLSNGTFTVVTPNITPDSTTGIGQWTEEMFLAKFAASAEKAHQPENPGLINTYMPWDLYAGMKPEDLKAIYAYLRSVKPIQHSVEKWPSPADQQKKSGALVRPIPGKAGAGKTTS